MISLPEKEGRLLCQEIEAALAQLTPDQRSVILLVGVQGMAYEAAAEALGCNFGTVKSRLNTALAHLKRVLGERLGVEAMDADSVGWRGDAIEAECFGFLAARVLRGLPISFPTPTGVQAPMRGGRVAGSGNGPPLARPRGSRLCCAKRLTMRSWGDFWLVDYCASGRMKWFSATCCTSG